MPQFLSQSLHQILLFGHHIIHWICSIFVFSVAFVPGVIPFIFYAVIRCSVKPLVILVAGEKAWKRLARRGRHLNIRVRTMWEWIPTVWKITLAAAAVVLVALAVWGYVACR